MRIKNCLFACLIMLSLSAVAQNRPMILTWDIPAPNTLIELPIDMPRLSTAEVIVDYGDGSPLDTITNSTTSRNIIVNHTYASPGVYDVKIWGDLQTVNFREVPKTPGVYSSKDNLVNIKQWGDIQYQDMIAAFEDCVNLDMTAQDTPDFSSGGTTKSLSNIFKGCHSLKATNSALNQWDIGNIRSLDGAFIDCYELDVYINDWDVSQSTFSGAIFRNCRKFNSPVDKWDVSGWRSFARQFQGCTSFNQDLSTWDTRNGFFFVEMFDSAVIFNQDISHFSFDGVIGGRADDMLSNSGMSKENYDKFLIAMAKKGSNSNIILGADNVEYCLATDKRQRMLIDSLSWNITGDVQSCDIPFPGDVGLPTVWLKANEDSLRSVANNSEVDFWKDASGFDNHARGVSGKTPQFKTTNADLINFNPTVDFDGTSAGDILTGGGLDLINDASLFVVAINETQNAGGSSNARPIFSIADGWGTNSTGYEIGLNAGAASNYYVHPGASPKKDQNWPMNGQPDLLSIRSENGAVEHFINDLSVSTANASFSGIYDSTYAIGGNKGAANPERRFKGRIAEAIYYEKELSDLQAKMVSSYLGVKYGLTLSSSPGANYVATDTSVIWDAAANGAYRNNIIAIGRDDRTALDQRASKSTAENGIVTLALEADFTTVNTARSTSHTNDIQYFFMSANAGTTATQQTELPDSYAIRIGREWRVSKTANFSQAVNLKFDGFDGTWQIIGSSTGDFSSDVFSVGSLNAAGEATNLQIPDGTYLTLAVGKGPGGVVGELAVWLRADLNITEASGDVSAWTSTGLEEFTVSNTGATKPGFNTNGINFNPSVVFTGSEFLEGSTSTLPNGTNAKEVFIVSKNATANGIALYVGDETAVSQQNLAVGAGSNTFFIDYTGSGALQGQVSQTFTSSSTTQLYHINGEANEANDSYDMVLNSKELGTPVVSVSSFVPNITGQDLIIGAKYNASGTQNSFFDGEIGEVIYYNRALSALERKKVQSYLAIKYGISLDQTTPTNYINSAGDTIWKASNAFNENIFGIGVDPIANLYQLKSKSVNPTAILTIDYFENPNENDSQFLMVSSQGLPDLENEDRIGRSWMVQNTHFDASTTLHFQGFDETYELIYSADPTFKNTQPLGSLDVNGTIRGINLANGYISLRALQKQKHHEFTQNSNN